MLLEAQQPHKIYPATYQAAHMPHVLVWIFKQCLTSRASLRRMVTTAKPMMKLAPNSGINFQSTSITHFVRIWAR